MMQPKLSYLTRAVIQQLWHETPTVRGLRLQLEPAAHGSFLFISGQWVDFHVPGLDSIGGYSICSPPSQLQQQGTLDLCVKASRHPCAQWVHQQATQAAEVYVQVGGSFRLAPNSRDRPNLFVAGGIGITALSSMIAELVEQQKAVPSTGMTVPRPFIMYSAAEPCEYALLEQLAHWHQEGAVQLQLHSTRVHGVSSALQAADSSDKIFQGCMPRLVEGRITRPYLQSALQHLRQGSGCTDAAHYVCGPPQMIEDVISVLHELGVLDKDVRFERWW